METTFLTALTGLFACGVLFSSSLAFIFAGMRFVGQLRREYNRSCAANASRDRQVGKAVRWLIFSGMCLFVQLVGSALSVIPAFFYDPKGYFLIMGLLFYGSSLAGVSQAFSFRPMMSDSRGLVASILEKLQSVRMEGIAHFTDSSKSHTSDQAKKNSPLPLSSSVAKASFNERTSSEFGN